MSLVHPVTSGKDENPKLCEEKGEKSNSFQGSKKKTWHVANLR